MKGILIKIISVSLLLFCITYSSKGQELTFDYDEAGNQVKREWICINCITSLMTNASTLSKSEQLVGKTKDNTFTQPENQKVIAYPNPLTETLNLRWSPFEPHITNVQIYSMTGVSYYNKNYRYLEAEFNEAIQFTRMTAGMYVVKVSFSNGKQELIKVIKQ